MIPDHWEEKRVKDIASLQSGDSITAMDIADDGEYPVYGGNGLRGYTKTYTNDGDYVLIGRQGALCGNINYAHGKFFATEHAVVVYTKKDEITYWLGETLRVANLNRLSMTAAQPGLAVSAISLQFIPYPPKEERTRIAQFIKEKTSDISRQVSLLTRKRDAYLRLKKSIINHAVTKGLNPNAKMKDSGIEWIGDVPEEWKPCRFKDFVKLCTVTSNSIRKIGLENIESGTGRFIQTDTEFEGNGVEFKKSDIVYGKLRPYLQKVWMAEFSGNAIGDFFVFKTQKNALPSYIRYVMLSEQFTKEADSSTVGAKMPRVSSGFILSLQYCLPSLQEQRSIATYLDDKCGKIDAIVANLNKQISRYGDLKRSLIDEVITGKRTV